MLQYLLNVTAVWLVSLVVFDVFLKRDTYHGYNRAYLLITLVTGLVLPLISLRAEVIELSQTMAQPVVTGVNTVKEGIASATPVGSGGFTIVDWIAILYLAGVVISLVLVLRELFVIRTLYKNGRRSRDGVWTVIETGKEHSPFSAFRYVFINSKDSYSATELKMILVHEEQHGHLLHAADLLFVQLVKVVFWFHPLVYVYLHRLLMVHEYQADKAVQETPQSYGSFLVEQALLSSAPSLSHSFSRSPIRKRINMLTQRSSALSGSKKLIVLPVLVVCIFCFSKNAFSDDKKVKNGNNVTYKGNVFEFGEIVYDTLMVENPVTGNQELKIAYRDPWPLKMNGQKVYRENEIDELRNKTGSANTYAGITSKAVKMYLLGKLSTDLSKLKDGAYYLGLSHIVVSKDGKVVYFDYEGLSYRNVNEPSKPSKDVDKTVQDAVQKKLGRLIADLPEYKPAIVDEKKVNSMINDIAFWEPFTVSKGKITSE